MTISLLTLAIALGVLVLLAGAVALHVHAMVYSLRVGLDRRLDAIQKVHGEKLSELETRLDLDGVTPRRS